MKLENISIGRNNNLDLIRFIAAVMVIFSHSFPVSMGMDVWDPLASLTHDQISFGSLAVGIFFLYGGFLICKSMHRLKTGPAFFKARIFRIFPPLIAIVFISAFILGPIMTTLPIEEYFKKADTYKYLLNAVMILQHNLPGVFKTNIYESVVNGPLWTLPVEFLCYIMCFIFYRLHLLEKRNIKYTVILFVAGCIGAEILSSRILLLGNMVRPMGLFFMGMLAFVFKDKLVISDKGAVLAFVLAVISLAAGIFPYTIFILLPYILFYLGYGTVRKFDQFARHGEISYGVYLCAWPIQQIICENFGGSMNPVVNFILATVFSVIVGFAVCKCIEEPLTKWLKKK